MGQSLVKNYLHIIFSTKHREPFINHSVESELHNYLGGICNNLECYPAIIGGYTDHIHILSLLSKKISLVTLIAELKAHSSKWIKTKNDCLKKFYWQDGYGAFSVNPVEIDVVKSYIKISMSIIRREPFKRNIECFLKNMMWSMMNDMFGTDLITPFRASIESRS